ncbi:MAG: hypothetical protein ABIQ12_12655 [Opitutaceae bacterium]
MKTLALALLVSAAALATSAARADTRFSFGVNIALPSYRTAPPVVAYAPPPTIVYAPVAPRGYWKDVTVKTWVPERVVFVRNRWGRTERVCEPGYFTYQADRVWIEADTYAPHNRGHASDHNRDYRGGWNR